MRWQRFLRLGLGLFALGFAIWVGVSIRGRQPAPEAPAELRSDPAAVVESVRGQSILHRGSRQDIRIDYERLLTYAQGRSKFFGARVLILDRAGRNFEIQAKEAEVADNQSQIDLRGDVILNASDGLVIRTQTATYTQSDEVVRTPDPVSFSRGRMSGTSVGASYDKLRDVLWLLDQAKVNVAPDAAGAGGATVTAGAAGYARRDRYMRFERGVHMTRGAQVVSADGAVAYLQPDADVLQSLELRGNSRVTGVGQGANGLEAMQARDMNLGYAPDGQTLQSATLIGDAVLQLAGGEGGVGQRLAAQAIDVTIAPDGQTVQALGAQDGVQLDLPAGAGAPARQIRAQTLDASGEPGTPGLKQARFVGQVAFRETQAATANAAATERVVRAEQLDLALQSGLASIDRATFTRGVKVQDGPREASGPTMIYDVAKGTIALAGPPEDERGFVEVSDARVNIEAKTLDWTLDGTRMVADGRVKSVLKPGGGKGAEGVKRPSMLAGDQPVNVTAQHLVYNQQSGRAEYTGESQLWQGQTSIKAESITLDESTGNLTASGNVRSVMRIESTEPSATTKRGAPATNGNTSPASAGAASNGRTATPQAPGAAADGAREGTHAVATAADLVYDDEARRATYTTNARMIGEAGDLRGNRIEVYFDESGRGLERLEAYEAVSFISAVRPDGSRRWGHGARLTYFAADERYVLSGAGATVVEQLPQECREATGRTLTFFKVTDSITVDGNENSRTLTRAGGKCPEQVP